MPVSSPRPSMTKKHFNAIAEAILHLQGQNLRERVARTLAPVLAGFNDSFDEERFIEASTAGKSLRRLSRRSGATPNNTSNATTSTTSAVRW